MAINQFKDYAQTKGYGDYTPLQKGGYVIQIKSATAKTNSVGQYVEIAFDIAEGEFANYYTKDYQNQTGEDKRWHGNFFLNVPKDDGSEKDGWTKRSFKSFTEALEASNPGYKFDWDEQKFRNLYIGGLFNEQEYRKRDGSIGRSTNLARVTTVEKIRTGNYKLPEDKLLAKDGSGNGGTEWMTVPDGVADELPF